MIILGISGGPHDPRHDPVTFPFLDGYWHDAAAVVLEDAAVLSAHEEERITRLKNTAHFPTNAVRACMNALGESRSIDAVAVYFNEAYWERFLQDRMLYDPTFNPSSARALIATHLEAASGRLFATEQIHFVRHHYAHAMSAWLGSGFDRALVVTLDGGGDAESGVVWSAADGRLEERRVISLSDSLGGLYLWVTRFLGYRQFDEYKVMGLAPFGDRRAISRKLTMIQLLAGGRFHVDWSFAATLQELGRARRRGEPFTAFHADVAAAVQDALEEAVLHLLRHFQQQTGHKRLCLAGGVAHNCAMNAAIAATERFDEIFVHPAADDAGCAVGAALAIAEPQCRPSRIRRLETVFWGSDVDNDVAVAVASRWCQYIRIECPDDVVGFAAAMLAEGGIIGWVQGRSEFGPRALGHRSLLADPRPVANRERINKIIKKRDSYRPFAPVVQAEAADRFFLVPRGADCSFMSFAVAVRSEWREQLAAITHVDGTARVQTITASQDAMLWSLLGQFAERTGIPVLLNTSLNVSDEPIVDSVDDAVVLLLTTDLSTLVAGKAVLSKIADADYLALVPHLPADARLVHLPAAARTTVDSGCLIQRGGPSRREATLTRSLFDMLLRIDGSTPLRGLAPAADDAMLAGILDLWRKRFILLKPHQPRNEM